MRNALNRMKMPFDPGMTVVTGQNPSAHACARMLTGGIDAHRSACMPHACQFRAHHRGLRAACTPHPCRFPAGSITDRSQKFGMKATCVPSSVWISSQSVIFSSPSSRNNFCTHFDPFSEKSVGQWQLIVIASLLLPTSCYSVSQSTC
jgi:hypothetical protein